MELEEIAETAETAELWLPEPDAADPAPTWVDPYEV